MSDLFAFVFHANIFVTSENRVKSNEFMFTRSDISTVVAYVRGQDLLSTRIITIKEFRTPARTPDGFVHELPGGSSLKDGEDPRVIASHELEEESGLKLDPERFHLIPARQLAATLSTHVAHVFAVEITEEEAASVIGTEHGVEEDTEHTYVGLASFQDILTGKVPFDFSMIGMVAAAGMYPTLQQTREQALAAWEASRDLVGEINKGVDQMLAGAAVPTRVVDVSAEVHAQRMVTSAAKPRVFLGGTCADTNWRDQLIEKLEIDYFNPVVENWTPECQAEELRQRESCDFVLYVIAPQMEGVYSIAEVVDDANQRPEKTVFCVIESDSSSDTTWTPAQRKSLKAVADLINRRGGHVCSDLDDVAAFLNGKA